MNKSVLEVGGELLVVSQFTLYGDCRKGRRPSFSESATPDIAQSLYNNFLSFLTENYNINVKKMVFFKPR